MHLSVVKPNPDAKDPAAPPSRSLHRDGRRV